jgi:hypothetical protein
LNKFFLLFSLLTFVVTSSNAQKVTVDELKRYAIAMDSIETLKNHLTFTVNKLSKGNANVSAQRYTVLIQIANDAAKLAEAKATPEEIAYVKRAVSIQNEETIKFQKAYQSLISNYVGDQDFGKVRYALKSDTILQHKYDSLVVTFK